MDANEEYVRSRWSEYHLWVYESKRTFEISLSGRVIKGSVKDKAAAWAKAAEYTRQREEDIRQIERELEVADRSGHHDFVTALIEEGDVGGAEVFTRECAATARTLQRLTQIRDEMKRGWKEQG
jgi:hypothetical protein